MPAPNCFIVYVTDVRTSADLYGSLFGLQPAFTSPRFIAFPLGGGVHLALWSGARHPVDARVPRTSEVCVNLEGGAEAVDAMFERWSGLGVEPVEPPCDEVFGRTFVVADPDGNRIRVAQAD